MMKEKVKKVFQNGNWVFFAIFILELILTIFITPNKYDDSKFLEWLTTDRTIINILIERYQTWTSRVIIDGTLFSILRTSKYLWVFGQAGMMTLLGYSISALFIKKENKKELNPAILFLILLYPLDVMASAGWGASTVNYIWPLATAMFSFIPIKKVLNGEKIKIPECVFYMFATLYACNQEQTCAIVVGTYLVFSVLLAIKNKKLHPFIVIELLLAIASLVFILTTPGNYVRQEAEVIENFPNFNMLTIQDKLSLGVTSTLGIIIGNLSIPFGVLSLIIAVYVFCTYKEKLYRIISLIPILSVSILGYFCDITTSIFPYFATLRGVITQSDVILTPANCDNFFYAIPLMFSLIIIASIVLSLLLIFKNIKNNIAVFVFLVGLASRLIMGFSPTIFASVIRTMVFFDFAMLISALLIWQDFVTKTDKNEKKVQRRVSAILRCTAICEYLNVLIVILLTQK